MKLAYKKNQIKPSEHFGGDEFVLVLPNVSERAGSHLKMK